jgi:hypothetical protein
MSSMSQQLSLVYLARHGDTAWTVLGRHTGLIDLPLTKRGEQNARRLGERLKGLTFERVFTSPLQRASRTCELAGFGTGASVDDDLVEWSYGDYDGKTISEIRDQRPGWDLFRDGCPGGESVADVAVRADHEVAADKNSTIIFPLPLELLAPFLKHGGDGASSATLTNGAVENASSGVKDQSQAKKSTAFGATPAMVGGNGR